MYDDSKNIFFILLEPFGGENSEAAGSTFLMYVL